MARPKTKDYDTLLARVPQDLADRVKHYAHLHRCSVSELIRDGLEWRIEQDTPGRQTLTSHQPANGHTPPMPENGDTVSQELSPMLRAAIAAAVRETLHTVFPMPHGERGEPDVLHEHGTDVLPQSPEAITSEKDVVQKHAVAVLQEDPTGDAVPAFDATKFYLGKLCPQGHDYAGTGKSVLRRHNNYCRECDTARKREQRRLARHGAPRQES